MTIAMRRAVLYLCFVCCSAGSNAVAQDAPPEILVRATPLSDWVLSEVGSVRFGRVALVTTARGHRLEVRRLQDEIPLPRPAEIRGAMPELSGNNLIVADFASSNRTPLGGYYNPFVRAPSTASAVVQQAPAGGQALALTCHNEAAGFCGLWIQLSDSDAAPENRVYLDGLQFSTLSFWISGRVGDEEVLLKVADAEWESKEAALPIGNVAEFLPTGRISTEWQQAVVPLDRLPLQIYRTQLALLALEAVAAGSTAVDLGPFAFSLAPDDLPSMPQGEITTEPVSPPHKATWVWNTTELIYDLAQRAALIEFLRQDGFDRVFLQLPNEPDRLGIPGEVRIDARTLRPLLAAFNRQGILVYALDGAPRHALPRFHAGVLQTVDNVIRYNRESRPEERFHGIHLDIEPYVVPGFHGTLRDSLLQGLLQLTAAVAERARSAALAVGVDIPFWYDAPAAYTYEPVVAEFRGVRKPVSEHIIDLVDDVSIMDYRTVALGADGTVRHASGEMEYAAKQDKSVFVGLETGELPDEVLLDFWGRPTRGLGPIPQGPLVLLVPAGDSLLVAYLAERSERDSAGTTAVIIQWLEAGGFQPADLWWWQVNRLTEVPASKITFARHDTRRLEAVMHQTANAFHSFPSFAGFALHYAQSYWLLAADRPARTVPRPDLRR